MKVFIEKTYDVLSEKAATDLIKKAGATTDPLVCVPSGDSPVGLYKHLVEAQTTGKLDTSHWRFISLDEWMGMNSDDEGSCTYYLSHQLIKPLGVEPNRMLLFDGKANADNQCRQMEDLIKRNGGIDVAILGLGLNGHIGMNEPGTPVSQRTHISDIDPLTQQVGQKYFKQETPLSQGLTLGLATLLEAKHIILLVSGAKKADIVKQVIEGSVTELIPASLLQNHPSVSVFLDEEAARLLQSNSHSL